MEDSGKGFRDCPGAGLAGVPGTEMGQRKGVGPGVAAVILSSGWVLEAGRAAPGSVSVGTVWSCENQMQEWSSDKDKERSRTQGPGGGGGGGGEDV